MWYIFILFLICFCKNFYCDEDNENRKSKRVYEYQFKSGDEHLTLPKIIVFSTYMGHIKYHHMPLLLESMRYNPQVDFYMINIIEHIDHHPEDIILLSQNMSVQNFHVVTQTMDELSQRVKLKLGIDVVFDQSWSYKMCDYKPTIAHLFSEYMDPKYKYWGFVDSDVIWGNFSRFAHWFQGRPFVISGWWRSTGAAQFFINEDWSTTFFNKSAKYVSLLTNKAYHNLDESGTQCSPKNVIDNGEWAMSNLIDNYAKEMNVRLNKGKHWKDHCFYDAGDAYEWAGPVVWFNGSLKVLHSSAEFPAGREILFFHRVGGPDLDIPQNFQDELFKDMMHFGYLLPSFIPLSSRYTSTLSKEKSSTSTNAWNDYFPFKKVFKKSS